MDDTHTIAAKINKRLGKLKSGSLQFFGDWFSRPVDNYHSIVGAESDGEILRVLFDDGESLSVWAPSNVQIDSDRFHIGDAQRVRWEWYYYGREKTGKNRYYLEYTRQDSGIDGATNVDWYQHTFSTSPKAPAVEIT